MENNHYRVTMVEKRDGKRRRIVQEAYAPRIADVVKFYGLNEPDIMWYSIKLIP